MAIALVQNKKNIGSSGVDSQAITFDAQPAVGNLVVVGVGTYSGALGTAAVSDNQGNTYTRLAYATRSPTIETYVGVYYTVIATTGTPFTVTVNPTGTSAYISTSIAEFSGASAAPADQNNAATGYGTAANSGNVTTATDNELYFGACTWSGGDSTLTEGATYTKIDENEGGASNMGLGTEYKTAVKGTYSADWTLGTARDWLAAIGSFLAATAAAGVPKQQDYYSRMRRA